MQQRAFTRCHALIAAVLALLALPLGVAQIRPPYLDPQLPLEKRVDDLVSRLTLAEKVSQMTHIAPAIERLGIPAYNWWNEGLHGVARAGVATVFPQAIGLAATWDTDLVRRVADIVSTEARAKYHDAIAHGNRAQYFGLTFWSPNINIFRDPRWGRGQETYGEDPYLTGQIGVAFVTGLQGDDPKYLKTISTPKHYAVHSGPEVLRHRFDVPVSRHDFFDTYAPAFRATVVDGRAQSVMCAYNAVLGQPACASDLLYSTLRERWRFSGYTVSDCGAISDIYAGHYYVMTIEQASALAVKAGTDLSCGNEYEYLVAAVRNRLLSEADIDRAVKRLFTARFRLGMFDPPEMVPYARIPIGENDSPAHRQAALQAARESIVLLKNSGILPLKNPRRIAVIGPNADSVDVLLGNYNGTPSQASTPLAGIRRRFGTATQITFAPGSLLTETSKPPAAAPADLLAAALEAARNADVVLAFIGLSPALEGEEMDVSSPGFFGGDRVDLELPRPQQQMLEAIAASGKPLVVVLLNGSALAANWAQEHAAAIAEAWYPGEEGGTAIAEVLAGEYNPAGRLPVTFYRSVAQLPPFNDYAMSGRTYRYFDGEPLYGFGYGLSYSRFQYSALRLAPAALAPAQPLQVEVTVRNAGDRDGDEVVEVYLDRRAPSPAMPFRTLQGFHRVHLKAGESRRVQFTLQPRQLAWVSAEGALVEEPGRYTISVGGQQPSAAAVRDGHVVQQPFAITGSAEKIEP